MILLRHGESEWNRYFGTLRVDPGIADPSLTERGRAQAEAAAERLRERTIERLVTSPYTRTLETAQIIARSLGLDILVEPLVRERCAFSCDQGAAAHVLAQRWPDIDFDGLPPRWWGSRIESHEALAARAATFAQRLAKDERWRHTAIVSHWGFIRALTGHSVGNAQIVEAVSSDTSTLTWSIVDD